MKKAPKNLVDAFQRLTKSKTRSVREFTREAYQEIECSAQEVKTKAEEKLRTVAKEVGTVENRLTRAAQAAWEVLSAPQPKDKD